MNQLLRIWNSLGATQRISLIVVPLLVFALGYGGLKWKHESDFRTLYTSLAPEDASAVAQKIHEAGIEYRLDETGATILVPSEKLAEARLALAGAGLPRTGRIGFELFDRANLGASDFTEQVNYRRALEGELERTVSTLSEVDQARIHITFAKDSVFLDARQPAKATVVLRLKRASPLQQANVTAIANLVASAVDGLAPEAVAIIDANGRLLNRPRAEDGEEKLAEANLDYRHQMEAELLAKINTALEPLLGAGRFHAGVNVECDFTATEENEESFDPAKSAVLTSQTTEESTSTGGAGGGGTPGTASNLPQPPARAAVASSGMLRRTDNVSYQPSRTVRRTVSPKGTLKRVSTAVLVDQTLKWEGTGAKARRTLIPPSPETMKAIHDVIAGITGFTEQRGDQISVETLPFESTLAAEPPAPPPPPSKLQPKFNFMQPFVLGAGGVIFLLVLAVVFLLMRRSGRSKTTDPEDMAPQALPGGAAGPAKSVAESRMAQQIADNQAEQEMLEAEALSRIKLPATKKTEVLVKHIREAVHKDPTSAANVLRTWVADLESKRNP